MIEVGVFACGWYYKHRCQPSVPQEIWRLLEDTFFIDTSPPPPPPFFFVCARRIYFLKIVFSLTVNLMCIEISALRLLVPYRVTQWSFSLLHPLSLSCIHFFDLFPVIGFSFQVYIYTASRLLLWRALNWQEKYIELLELLLSLRTPAAVSKCLKKLCIGVTYNIIYSRVDIHFICRKLKISKTL